MSLELDLQYGIEQQGLPPQEEFIAWAEAALADKRSEAELSIRIVDEQESAELNRRYRGKEGATNVLSFPSDLPVVVESSLLGDLVICAPVVRQQALEQGKMERAHWAHMVVHGVLHLLGFDHQAQQQAAEMEAIEVGVLARLGFPDPYRLNGAK